MPTNKPVPRFVPTLTEVVRPGLPPRAIEIDPERLAEQVLQAVKPRIEQQLRASLQLLIEQHLRAAAPRLQHELEDAVLAAVTKAIARTNQPKT